MTLNVETVCKKFADDYVNSKDWDTPENAAERFLMHHHYEHFVAYKRYYYCLLEKDKLE